jgi:lysophospholipase L1-like esterase
MNHIIAPKLNSDILVLKGRVLVKDQGIHFFYTGSGFDASIEGSSLSLKIETDFHEDVKAGYLSVIVKSQGVRETYTYRLAKGQSTIKLFELSYGRYVVHVRKRSESMMTRTILKELSTDGKFLSLEKVNQRSIEWIGDSLTCGYGNLGENFDTPFDTKDEDGMQSFAVLASKTLDMDYDLVSVSGIGVYKSFYAEVTMPCIYEQYDIYDRTPYPFTKHHDIVVINLGTNDHSYMNFLMENTRVLEQQAFQKAYQSFVEKVRFLNPKSIIICISQGERQFNVNRQIEQVVNIMSDPQIHHLRLSDVLESEGIGSQYHPKVSTHKRWAQEIQTFIQNII